MPITLTTGPSPFSIIHIEGVAAETFLQSQLTLDIATVTPMDCRLGAYCNRQGYVESLLWLYRTDTGFGALLNPELVPHTLALLKKYGAFSKVQFRIEELDRVSFSVENQDTPLRWQADLQRFSLRAPSTLWVEQQSNSLSQWRAYCLTAAIPTLNVATQGLFRPHDLNLPALGAVSFTKGCYPGQEIVARMHYRGKPKVHLRQLRLSTSELLCAGQVLEAEDRGIATLVDALAINDQQWLVLAAMQDSAFTQLPLCCQFGELSHG